MNQVVARTGVKTESGYLYFVDKDGDLARSPMSRAGSESNDIKIENEFDIISISNKNESHQLLLKVKNDISENQIQFTFDQVSLDLEKWEIYDEFGNKTVFKFTKTKKNIFISKNLFLVKYN